ncbi:MAG TPA: TonB family protein [Bacteroidetes bacterium]|nr:TonB family protein [Bacteroidota bacterium]
MTTKTKGILGSTAIHIIIIVLLVLFGFSTPLPLPGEEGIIINFGDSDEGAGLVEPREMPKRETASAQANPQEDESAPITQDFEEAPSLPDPKPDPKPETETPKDDKPTEPKPEEPKEEEKPREVDRRTLFPGQQTSGDTSGEGETGNEGNQGDVDGDPTSTNREGGTTGGGDGISFSLGSRAALSLPQPDYPKQKSGRVVVEVTVDRNGNVTAVRGGVKGSTTYDTDLINAAEKAARRARFNLSPDAPAYQTGTITYVFTLQQ